MACRHGDGPTSAAPVRTAGAMASASGSAVVVTGWKPGRTGGATTPPEVGRWPTWRRVDRAGVSTPHRRRPVGGVERVESTRPTPPAAGAFVRGVRMGRVRADVCGRGQRPGRDPGRGFERQPGAGGWVRGALPSGPGQGIILSCRGGQLWARCTREVYRRRGRWARRMACTLLGVSLVVASTAALEAAGSSRASAAGSGREPLRGHQGVVPPGATLIGPAPSRPRCHSW